MGCGDVVGHLGEEERHAAVSSDTGLLDIILHTGRRQDHLAISMSILKDTLEPRKFSRNFSLRSIAAIKSTYKDVRFVVIYYS